MQTVDNETLEMMRDFLNSQQVLQTPQSWFINEMMAIIKFFFSLLPPPLLLPSKWNKKEKKHIQIQKMNFFFH